MTTLAFAPTEAPVPRDRWGRPLVTPPGGGRPIPYRRATRYIDVLDNKYQLQKWMQRQVAVGLARRPDLLTGVAAHSGDPDAAKKDLDRLCEQASEAAGSSAKATVGTAFHAFAERVDLGLDPGAVPEEIRPALDAYQAATAGLDALHIEQMTVNDELQAAGTPDRIVTIDGIDGCFIADLKTGPSTLKYGLAGVAAQMALYAHSVLWNHETNQRHSVEGLSTTAGLVIAVDIEAGTCELGWIDLAAGWSDVQTAQAVWASHARKKDLQLAWIQQPQPGPAPDPEPAQGGFAREKEATVAAALDQAIAAAPTVDALTALWAEAQGAGHWGDSHTQAAAVRKQQLINQ